MGFWDRQIVDFEISGIRVSDLEVDALENGGPVAIVVPLPSPDWIYGNEYDCDDGQGQRVYIPLMLNAEAPLEIMQKGSLRHRPMTNADVLDSEWGETWREFPSYIGYVEWESAERFSQYFTGWQEYCRSYRLWTGRPLTAQEVPVYKRIQDAAFERLNESDYFFVEAVVMMEESEGMDLEAAAVHHGLVKPPAGVDVQKIQDRWDMCDHSWQDEYVLETAKEFAEHCERRHIFGWSWADSKTEPEVTPMTFKPMEHFMKPGDKEAYELWTGLVARREVMKRQVQAYWHPNNAYAFDWNERYFA